MERILIVDDFQSNLIFIKNVLEDEFDVTTAASGAQALKILKMKEKDLVILDIAMPEMDGIETLQKLRETEKGKNIPVIFLTGQADIKNILRGHQLGVKAVLAKPIVPQLMKERIRKVLSEIEQERRQKEDE